MSAIVARCVAVAAVILLLSASHVLAQEKAQEPSGESAPEAVAEPVIKGSDPGPGFPFLGVGAAAQIDPTRKAAYEEYALNQTRYCTGCWCNNVFGERLSESFNELVGKSEVVAALWEEVSHCIDPARNRIPQIRTVPLDARYDDAAYKRVTFYFSEFLDKLLAVRVLVNKPEDALEPLVGRFGEPVNIEDTWYVWQLPEAVLVYDLFNVAQHDREQGELLVVYSNVLGEHIEKAREVERVTR